MNRKVTFFLYPAILTVFSLSQAADGHGFSASVPAEGSAGSSEVVGAVIAPVIAPIAPPAISPFPAAVVPEERRDTVVEDFFSESIVVKREDWRPLTGEELAKLYFRKTYLNPNVYLTAAALAAFDQHHRFPSGWEQGASGYGKRMASRMGQLAIQYSIEAGGSALMGYDPRYVRLGEGGFLKRAGHALAWNFLALDTAGHARPDLPRYAGWFGSAFISKAWEPGAHGDNWRAVREGAGAAYSGCAIDLLREFAPELKRMVFRK